MTIKTRISFIFSLVAGAALLIAPAARAQAGFENLDRLDSLVAMTVGANLGEPGGPAAQIDRRLRLKPCPETPKVDGPTFGAAIVSCAQTGWRLRVPLVPAAQPDAAPATRNLVALQAPARAATQPAAPPAAEAVVKKGDPVELIAGNDLFSVSRMMVADEDGEVGQYISVREDRKSTPVSARVERAGVVRAPTI